MTIKVYEDTRQLLRLIAAVNDEQITDVAHRLTSSEWQSLIDSGEVPVNMRDDNHESAKKI